jgi:hypothetical protein
MMELHGSLQLQEMQYFLMAEMDFLQESLGMD